MTKRNQSSEEPRVSEDGEELVTVSQKNYLFDLVVDHPNFQKVHHHDVWEATDEWVCDWLNEKYGDFLSRPLHDLGDLAKYEATELITRLKSKH